MFGGAEPQDAIPEFDEFVHVKGGRRPPRARVVRQAPPRASAGKPPVAAAPARRWVFGVRIAICSILLVFGLVGSSIGILMTVGYYADAGRLAAASACAAGVDPATTTEDCVGTLVLVSPDGAFSDGGEDTIELDLPPANSGDSVWVDYPGNAQFDAATGDGMSATAVRAEFWEGKAVTLTAGRQGVTVTTDLNPNNQAGAGLGILLVSFALVLLAGLLFIGIRSIRLRWLRPGIVLRLFVSGCAALSLGLFAAGCCLVNQPARVMLVAVIAPPITVAVTGILWLLAWKGREGRALRVRAVR